VAAAAHIAVVHVAVVHRGGSDPVFAAQVFASFWNDEVGSDVSV
jgi:hypothetical protein